MVMNHVESVQLRRKGYSNIRALEASSDSDVAARFHDMAQKAGISAPELYIADFPTPNASAFANNKIIVSSTLLTLLNDKEINAILAHEIGHAAAFSRHTRMAQAPRRGMMGGLLAGMATGFGLEQAVKNDTAKLAIIATSIVVGAFMGRKIGLKSITQREDEADDMSISLTGDKEAFASALTKIDQWMKEKGYPTSGKGYRSVNERVMRL